MKSTTLNRLCRILVITVFFTFCFGFMAVGSAGALDKGAINNKICSTQTMKGSIAAKAAATATSRGYNFTLKATPSYDGSFRIFIDDVPSGSFERVELWRLEDGETDMSQIEGYEGAFDYSLFASGSYFEDKNIEFEYGYTYVAYAYNLNSSGSIADYAISDDLVVSGKSAKTPKFTDAKATGNVATQITLKWGKVSGAAGYKIYLYNTSTKKYVLKKTVTGGSTTSAKITKLTKNKKATFKIAAYKGSYVSPKSSTISEKPRANAATFSVSTKISKYTKGVLTVKPKKVWYNSKKQICVKYLFVNRTTKKVRKVKNLTIKVKHKDVLIAKQTFSKTIDLKKGSKKWVTFTFTKGTKKKDRNLRYGSVEIPAASFTYTV